MKVLKGVVLTSLAQLSKLVSGLVLLKLLALYLGPEGLGKLGHFINFFTVIAILAGGGVGNGVTKYIAELNGDSYRQKLFLNAAIPFTIIFNVLIFTVLCVLNEPLSEFIFGTTDLSWLILLSGVFAFFITIPLIFNGVVNGIKETGVFVRCQLFGVVLLVPSSFIFVNQFGFLGAVFSIQFSYACFAIPAIYFMFRMPAIRDLVFNDKKFTLDLAINRKLFHFTLMLTVSAVVFPLVEILIREKIIDSAGYAGAGLWQALIRLSAAYMSFFAVFLSVYFVPRICVLEDVKLIRKKVFSYIALCGGVFLMGGGVLFLLRETIVPLVFSEEFSGISEFLHFQLVGDFFKAASFVIGFYWVSKANVKFYILGELLQGFLLVLFVYSGSEYITVRSVVEAYCLANISYFCVAMTVFCIQTTRRQPGRQSNKQGFEG